MMHCVMPQINYSTRALFDVTLCHVLSVIFNEPLTFLQRVAEYMEYVHLLHTAASLDDQLQRMQVNELLVRLLSRGLVTFRRFCCVRNSLEMEQSLQLMV